MPTENIEMIANRVADTMRAKEAVEIALVTQAVQRLYGHWLAGHAFTPTFLEQTIMELQGLPEGKSREVFCAFCVRIAKIHMSSGL